MEINLGLILASLINFFILFAILKHFFFGKVKAIIDEREEYINEQMDDAEEATNKARLLAIENERNTNIEVSPQYRLEKEDVIVVIGKVNNIDRFEENM